MFITVLTYLLLFVEVACSLLLIGVILLQRSKGQGIGLAFGAGMGESLFGSQVGNVLTRTTVILGIVFLVNTALLAVLGGGRRPTSVADRISVEPAPVTPVSPERPSPGSLPGQVPMPDVDDSAVPPAPSTVAGPEETAPPAAEAPVPREPAEGNTEAQPSPE